MSVLKNMCTIAEMTYSNPFFGKVFLSVCKLGKETKHI